MILKGTFFAISDSIAEIMEWKKPYKKAHINIENTYPYSDMTHPDWKENMNQEWFIGYFGTDNRVEIINITHDGRVIAEKRYEDWHKKREILPKVLKWAKEKYDTYSVEEDWLSFSGSNFQGHVSKNARIEGVLIYEFYMNGAEKKETFNLKVCKTEVSSDYYFE